MLAAAAAPSWQLTVIEQQEQNASRPEELPMERQIKDNSLAIKPISLVDSSGSKISWLFEDSKGQEYRLTVTQEAYLKNTVEADIPIQTLLLKTKDGDTIAVRDYSQYVRPTVELRQLADRIYENAESDYQFIYEVWYIVMHSTKYAHEDFEIVSLPLETLYNSRGDCEDLTILMASIIDASSYTKDWTIKIAYFDASDPDESNAVNHVALFIQTDQFSTFVESTNSELGGMSVWKKVDGWYVEVNRSNGLDVFQHWLQQ